MYPNLRNYFEMISTKRPTKASKGLILHARDVENYYSRCGWFRVVEDSIFVIGPEVKLAAGRLTIARLLLQIRTARFLISSGGSLPVRA